MSGSHHRRSTCCRRHHHGDVAVSPPWRRTCRSPRHASESGAQLDDDNNVRTGSGCSTTQRMVSVHVSRQRESVLNTGREIEHDVGVNQSVGLVGPSGNRSASTRPAMTSVSVESGAVVDGKAGLVGFVNFQTFRLDRYVVRITDGARDTPNTHSSSVMTVVGKVEWLVDFHMSRCPHLRWARLLLSGPSRPTAESPLRKWRRRVNITCCFHLRRCVRQCILW